MTTTSDASRFRVERAGQLQWHVLSSIVDDKWHVSERLSLLATPKHWMNRDSRIITNDEFMLSETPHESVLFDSEAEARYRLLLYQNPREALAAFYRATGGEYESGCPYDHNRDGDCHKHPNGCPPSAETLGPIADWMEEHGMELEAMVLRTVAQGAKS